MKYIISTKIGNGNHAGNKARNDIESIAFKVGFKFFPILSEKFFNRKIFITRGRRFLEPIEQFVEIKKRLHTIPKDSTVLLQYPLEYVDKKVSLQLLEKTKKSKNLKLIALIHDINSLRNYGEITPSFDKKWLELFDSIIAHNATMKSILQNKYNISAEIKELDFFDYITDYKPQDSTPLSNKIIFAGNLDKSLFLKNLKSINGISFNLYGPCINPNIFISSNVFYNGQFTPDDIVKKIEGNFGLVWDGESITTCSGSTGDYLKYNTSHKVSLYLVAGKPVIVWKHSAIAPYIQKYNIGILVESLEELPDKLNSITTKDYQDMFENVKKLSLKLSAGKQFENILSDMT